MIRRLQRDQVIGVLLVLAVFGLIQMMVGNHNTVLVSSQGESAPQVR